MAEFSWTDPSTWDMDTIGQIIGGVTGGIDAYQGADDVTQKPWFLPGQQEGLTDAVGAARGQFEAGPNQYYPGSTVAGLDPTLEAGWNERLSNTDRLQQMADTSGQTAMNLANGGDRVGGFTLQDQIGFGIPEQYQNAIMSPIMKQLNEQVIPGIHTAATSQGAFGGSRMQQQKSDAAAQATDMATQAMIRGNLDARGQSIGQRAGDISAQLSGRAQDIGQNQNIANNQLAGIGALGTAMNQSQIPGATMAEIGANRMDYNQRLLDDDVNRFNWNTQEGNNYVDRLFSRLQGSVMPNSYVQPAPSTNWTDLVTGGAAGANLWNNVFKTPTTNPADALQPVTANPGNVRWTY